jgi:hypothetical protein
MLLKLMGDKFINLVLKNIKSFFYGAKSFLILKKNKNI